MGSYECHISLAKGRASQKLIAMESSVREFEMESAMAFFDAQVGGDEERTLARWQPCTVVWNTR